MPLQILVIQVIEEACEITYHHICIGIGPYKIKRLLSKMNVILSQIRSVCNRDIFNPKISDPQIVSLIHHMAVILQNAPIQMCSVANVPFLLFPSLTAIFRAVFLIMDKRIKAMV